MTVIGYTDTVENRYVNSLSLTRVLQRCAVTECICIRNKMYSFIYLIVVVVGVLVSFNEICADLDIKRDAKLSTVDIHHPSNV